MKNLLLFALLISLIGGFSACSKDDVSDDPNGNDTTNTDPGPETVDDLVAIFAGQGEEVNYNGKQLFRAYWKPDSKKFGQEEDMTDDPSVEFKKNALSIKYDDYNSPRLGYPVGNGEWSDDMGRSGFNWEMKHGEMDTVYINKTETRPPLGGRHEWVHVRVTETEWEYTRIWQSGSERYRDRMIWERVQE